MQPWLLDESHTALLVIDMQNDFILAGAALEVPMARERLPTVKKLIDGCRFHLIPVIFTRHVHIPDGSDSPLELLYFPELQKRGLRQGTAGAEIYAELQPMKHDPVITKHRYDAFYGTDLEIILRTIRGFYMIDTVIISGTVTNICCESTARSAFMRDYKVVFCSDATAGLDMASHNATLEIMKLAFGRVLSVEEILSCLPQEKYVTANQF